MTKRLLIVEDEPGLVLTLTDRLGREGYSVESAQDGRTGLERALQEPFDLLLLDVMLPGQNGFDVLRDLRQHGIETPVIMLTARGQVVDKVVGLKLGADDYLTKPFEMMELVARIEARLRRSAPKDTVDAEAYRFGNVLVDFRDPAEAWKALGDGYRVEVRVVLWDGANVLKVPIGSLFRRGEAWAAYVASEGRAELRVVKIDHRTDREAEVIGGLREGDAVILHPSDALTEASRITPREP